jgi:hypothetical protein
VPIEQSGQQYYLQEAGLIEPPDGGYGWVIVAGSFLANMVVDGVGYTAGQGFQPAWEKYYSASTGQTAWVVSLLTGFYLLSGACVQHERTYYPCRSGRTYSHSHQTRLYTIVYFAISCYVCCV